MTSGAEISPGRAEAGQLLAVRAIALFRLIGF